jgi:hypothetical protein
MPGSYSENQDAIFIEVEKLWDISHLCNNVGEATAGDHGTIRKQSAFAVLEQKEPE